MLVCGLGQVGFRIVDTLLRLGESVTIITADARDEFAVRAEAEGALIIRGDARSDQVLLQAGLLDVKALIACVDSDVTNIEIALDARRLAPDLRIVARLFDQTLARRLESTVGISRALGMSVLAAPAFAAAALGEHVFGSFTHGGETYLATKLSASDVKDSAKAILCVKSEGDSEVEALLRFVDYSPRLRPDQPKLGPKLAAQVRATLAMAKHTWRNVPKILRVLTLLIIVFSTASVFVFRIGLHISTLDALYFVITTVTTTGYGDITPKDGLPWLKIYGCLLMLFGSASVATLYSLLTDFVVSARFNELLGKRVISLRGHVVVVGLGDVGVRTAQSLVEMGSEVAVIDLDSDVGFRRMLHRSVAFSAGDGRDIEALERAGVQNARAVISVTGNDAVNLSVGLASRSLNSSARVIVQIFDGNFARKVDEVMDVNAALSASQIAAPGFVGAALFPEALFCYIHGNRFCVVKADESGRLNLEAIPLGNSGDGAI